MQSNDHTRSTSLEALAALVRSREHAIRALGVKRLAVFGSVAKATDHDGSDVDFLVEFAPGQKTLSRFLELGDLLESLTGRSVDLVTTEGLSPFIGPHILAEATDVLRAA